MSCISVLQTNPISPSSKAYFTTSGFRRRSRYLTSIQGNRFRRSPVLCGLENLTVRSSRLPSPALRVLEWTPRKPGRIRPKTLEVMIGKRRSRLRTPPASSRSPAENQTMNPTPSTQTVSTTTCAELENTDSVTAGILIVQLTRPCRCRSSRPQQTPLEMTPCKGGVKSF